MTDAPVLLLYYKPACPYCKQVLDYLDEAAISLPLKNIDQETDARDELLHLGGKMQVPCLFIDGKALYMPGEIINWLEAYYKESK